jgi:hypothetical protein
MTCIKEKLIGYERTIDSDFKKFNDSYFNFLNDIDFMVSNQLLDFKNDKFEWTSMCLFLSMLKSKTSDFESYAHCLGNKNWLLNDFKSVIENHCCDECDKNKS